MAEFLRVNTAGEPKAIRAGRSAAEASGLNFPSACSRPWADALFRHVPERLHAGGARGILALRTREIFIIGRVSLLDAVHSLTQACTRLTRAPKGYLRLCLNRHILEGGSHTWRSASAMSNPSWCAGSCQKGFSGASVLEIVDDFDGDTYRAAYTVRFARAVYVLHAFQKKSRRGIATPKAELDLIERRLKRAKEDYDQWSSIEKPKFR